MDLKHCISIILSKPEGNINLGLIARSMKNFNITSLMINQPIADRKNPETIAFAPNASDILENAIQIKSLKECKHDIIIGFTRRKGQFRREDFLLPGLNDFLKEKLSDNPQLKIGLLFGNEQTGLSDQELSYADFICSIPTHNKQASLNLSHAVALSLYEISKISLQFDESNNTQFASLKEIKECTHTFMNLLSFLNYFDDESQKNKLIIYFTKIFSRGIREKTDSLIFKNLFQRIFGIISKYKK